MALNDFEGVKIRMIGRGMENYLTPSLGNFLLFKESLEFPVSSLATIAKNPLKTGLESFKQLSRKFIGTEAREFHMLGRKFVYPYEYMDSCEKMD